MDQYHLPESTDDTDMRFLVHGLSLVVQEIAQLGQTPRGFTKQAVDDIDRLMRFQVDILRANEPFARDLLDDLEAGRGNLFGNIEVEELREVVLEGREPDDLLDAKQEHSPGYY